MFNTAQTLSLPWHQAHAESTRSRIDRALQLGRATGRHMLGTPARPHRNLRDVDMPDGATVRLTRGERKQIMREATIGRVIEQQANPDNIDQKYLSSTARFFRKLAVATAVEVPAPKRSRAKKAAA